MHLFFVFRRRGIRGRCDRFVLFLLLIGVLVLYLCLQAGFKDEDQKNQTKDEFRIGHQKMVYLTLYFFSLSLIDSIKKRPGKLKVRR